MFKYKNPLDEGYIKLNKKDSTKIINKYEKNKLAIKYEVYENNNYYLILELTPIWVKILNICLSPLLVFVYGFGNIKDLINDLSDMWNEKETGNYISIIINKEYK